MLCKLCILLSLVVISLFVIKWCLRRKRRKNTIGIFHLYCSSGGGGERVLWHTVKILLEKYPKYSIYIYTSKNLQHDSYRILLEAKNLFKIDLLSDDRALERLEFIPLGLSRFVEADKYPFMTLFWQNIMSIVVAFQAAYHFVPEIYIESIGFTCTLPVFKLFGCTVITYVHYPTISSDMITNVQTSKHASFNNRSMFVRSPILRQVKLFYYKLLAISYGFAGRRADLVMVNSTWTRNHILSLWQTEVHIVYPPCDVHNFKSISVERRKPGKNLKIISVAQFRPEKNHEQLVEAFDIFVNRTQSSSELVLYGGCRDESDKKRVDYLIDLVHRLDLSSRIRIIVNATFEQLIAGMKDANVAIHAMKNEHFGIVLLEFMSAGLITVAHNSGGPQMDIIEDGKNGFLCSDVEDFAEKLVHISNMTQEKRDGLKQAAIQKADKFSAEVFEKSLLEKVDKFFM